MHVLRAEKGYVILGQDTDGTATPDDLGMGWIVNPGKGDFIGKRSLVRPDTMRDDRKHLVGLRPDDPAGAPRGSSSSWSSPPRWRRSRCSRHVTSSYRSAALGRSFALAMVAGGRTPRADAVRPAPGGTVPVTVTGPVFFDPEGRAPRRLAGPLAGRESDLARIPGGRGSVPHPVDVRCTEGAAASLGFPVEPNTVGDMARGALWLGPDEWLVVAGPGVAPALAAGLRASRR